MVYQTISCAQYQINVLKFVNVIIKYLLAVTEDKIKDEIGSSCAQHQINVLKFMNAIIKYLLAVTEDEIKDEAGNSQDDTTAGQNDEYHCH